MDKWTEEDEKNYKEALNKFCDRFQKSLAIFNNNYIPFCFLIWRGDQGDHLDIASNIDDAKALLILLKNAIDGLEKKDA
jgi:hypothetical protein